MKKILIILTIFIMCNGYVMAIDEDKDGIDDEKEEIIDEIADKQKRDPGWGTDVDNDLFYYRPKLIGKIMIL